MKHIDMALGHAENAALSLELCDIALTKADEVREPYESKTRDRLREILVCASEDAEDLYARVHGYGVACGGSPEEAGRA